MISPGTAQSDYSADASTDSSVTVDLTELAITEPHKWCSIVAALEVPREFEPPTVSPSQLVLLQSNPETAHWGFSKRLSYETAPPLSQQAGIDFVLE
jgi:hypothetical protein